MDAIGYALALVLQNKLQATSGVWQKVAPMLVARSNAAAFAINGVGYVVGGQIWNGSATVTTTDNEMYDPITNTWTTKAAFPSTNAGQALTYYGAINGYGYVAGGVDGGNNRYGTAFKYDPTANVWSSVAAMPQTLYAGASFVLNGYLYTAGGYTGSAYSNQCYKYNPSNNSWSSIATAPTSEAWTFGFSVGSYGYYGAGQSSGSAYNSDVNRYDPSSNTWSSVSSLPIGNGNSWTGFSDGTYGYAAGGEAWVPNSWQVQNVVLKFDPGANQWTYAPSLLDKIYLMAPFVINGVAYLAGGQTDAYTSSTKTTEVQAYFTNMALYVQQQLNNILAWLAAKES
jgi:N-acetylneuraminic acid mutarotase